jgi:hypothetical protein
MCALRVSKDLFPIAPSRTRKSGLVFFVRLEQVDQVASVAEPVRQLCEQIEAVPLGKVAPPASFGGCRERRGDGAGGRSADIVKLESARQFADRFRIDDAAGKRRLSR